MISMIENMIIIKVIKNISMIEEGHLLEIISKLLDYRKNYDEKLNLKDLCDFQPFCHLLP